MAANKRKQLDSDSSEEYEVERIESHRVLRKTRKQPELQYLIKWKNYSPKDNTWEPSESLDNAHDLVDEYWATKGGQQKREEVFAELNGKTEKSTSTRNDDNLPTKRARRTRQHESKSTVVQKEKEEVQEYYESEEEFEYSETEIEDENFRIEDDWKDVKKIEHVRPLSDTDKTLYAIARWSDGKIGKYKTSFIAKKCPMKLIEFYEKRLIFENNKKK